MIERYRDRQVEIATRTEGRRLLVLADVDYPGWVARVDGRPVEILRANFAFRAVPVPAGAHRVTFRYEPASFLVGSIVSIVTLAAGLLGGILTHRKARRQAGGA